MMWQSDDKTLLLSCFSSPHSVNGRTKCWLCAGLAIGCSTVMADISVVRLSLCEIKVAEDYVYDAPAAYEYRSV